MSIYESITQLVGRTPVVSLPTLTQENEATVYLKLESFNPGSSVKDRIALAMIEQAEADGRLKPKGTIIEPTSGNTGIGLAMIGAAKGYQVILVMPDTMSIERRKLMYAYGAKIVLTPGSEGIKGSIAKARELAAEHHYFMPLQFENEANPNMHEQTTGPEIVSDFKEIGLDAFVAGVGTGGTITGSAKVLKKAFPTIQIVAVEPKESAVLSGNDPGPHKIQGIGTGFVPKVLDQTILDEVIAISSEEAMEVARDVATKEGILIGISSGAAVAGALRVAKQLGAGKNVLVVIPDNGERYLSTALYETNETRD